VIVWTDLETSGLDSRNEDVLEVAAIITDDQLNEVARFERVLYYRHADAIIAHCERVEKTIQERLLANPGLEYAKAWELKEWRVPVTTSLEASKVDPYVVKMHRDNGLWEACRYGQALATVDRDLRDFIRQHGVKTSTVTKEDGTSKVVVDKPQLGGSTISFDRQFLNAHFPLTTAEGKDGVLNHRNVDVSTFNEVARRFWPQVHKERPGVGSNSKHRGMDDISMSIAVLKHYLHRLAPIPQPDYSKISVVAGNGIPGQWVGEALPEAGGEVFVRTAQTATATFTGTSGQEFPLLGDSK
jgi:oligoribonuclease (3'-5' exoribonuclease)